MLKIDGQMVGDLKLIAESFNDIFCDIGAKLDAEIPVGENNFRQYLKNKVLIYFYKPCMLICCQRGITDIKSQESKRPR